MKHILFLTVVAIALTACATPATTINTSVPSREIVTPSSAPPPTSNPSPTAKSTEVQVKTVIELGVADADVIKAFVGAKFNQEADRSYSVKGTSYSENTTKDGFDQKSEKYIIDKTTFNIHQDLNNAYAPATVNAKDTNGEQVTLIWNEQLGFVEKFNPSTDIENPTDIPYEARIPMLQSILLEHGDPFKKRSDGFIVRSERTDTGRVVYLRTDDAKGTNSKITDYWLRVHTPDKSFHYINPTDINDLDGRKIMMCAYPNAYINYTDGKNPTLDKKGRTGFLSSLKAFASMNRPIWGILQVDNSFFDKFHFLMNALPEVNSGDLNYLLTFTNLQSALPRIFSDRTHFNHPEDKNNVIETSMYVQKADGTFVLGPTDTAIQEQIIPCSPQ